MKKHLVLILLSFILASCFMKDKLYYRTHVKELQQAIKACPQKHPQRVSCQELQEIVEHVNQLGEELQINPPQFGLKILKLQQTIATQRADLEKNSQDKTLQASLEDNQRDLEDYLAVVQWLESPVSK